MVKPARECHERLQEARVLLDGTDDQHARGLALLREIARDHSGTDCARQALDVIQQVHRPRRPAEPDPELKSYEWDWLEIMGLTDPRLVPLLKKLKERPAIAAGLRPRVIQDIGKWIETTLPTVSSEMDQRDLRALENAGTAFSEIDAYNTDEIRELRNVLFGIRYQELSCQIRDAAEQWSIEECWKLFAAMQNVPRGFQEQASRLREEIYEADSFRKTAQDLINHSPKNQLAGWPDARKTTDFLKRVEQFVSTTRVPDGWARQLDEQVNNAAGLINGFLKKKAVANANISDLRSFWAEYERLDAGGLSRYVAVDRQWFQQCLDQVLKDERSKVEAARNPEELGRIGLRIEGEAERLPQPLSDRLEFFANEVNHLASVWKSMLAGHLFAEPVSQPNLLALPRAIKNEIPKYKAWLKQIEEAFSLIEQGGVPAPDETCDQAMRVAEDVLSQHPGHAYAEELKRRIRQRRLANERDRTLLKFDVERFYELIRTGGDDNGCYAGLERETLNSLANLARRSELSSWREAEKWWADWRVASSALPDSAPEALMQAVRNQEAIRAREWFRVLDQVNERNDLGPEEHESVARSLTGELERLSLQGYYAELYRKAKLGFVSRHIAAGQFEEARKSLVGLDADHSETIKLQTRVDVEQARATGTDAVANVLRDNWNEVDSAYGDEAQEVLLDALERAWEENEAGALKMLRAVMGRVIQERSRSGTDLADLKRWEAWLTVEDAIKTKASLLSIDELVSYLKQARPGDSVFPRRLGRLVAHWQEHADIKMLAWAYQAFSPFAPSVLPGPDPAEELVKRSDQVADRILKTIAEREDLGLVDLRSLQDELTREQHEWKDLGDFFDRLQHGPKKRHQPSETFTRAALLVEGLVGIFVTLERLNEADLREESNGARLAEARLLLKRKFKSFAIQGRVLDQVERLEYLKEVPGFEPASSIVEIASKCGSGDLGDVFNLRLFPELAEKVRGIAHRFELARAVAGPMWKKVSEECSRMVDENAGILLPPLLPADLNALADRIDLLGAEERAFAEAIEELKKNEPPVPVEGVFNPEQHLDYLSLFPKRPPGSKKVYRRFDRFAARLSTRAILQQSRRHLPAWIQEYLDKLDKGVFS